MILSIETIISRWSSPVSRYRELYLWFYLWKFRWCVWCVTEANQCCLWYREVSFHVYLAMNQTMTRQKLIQTVSAAFFLNFCVCVFCFSTTVTFDGQVSTVSQRTYYKLGFINPWGKNPCLPLVSVMRTTNIGCLGCNRRLLVCYPTERSPARPKPRVPCPTSQLVPGSATGLQRFNAQIWDS